MKNGRIESKIERISYQLDTAEYQVDRLENSLAKFNEGNVKDLLDLSASELKLLIALVSIAKNNVIDMAKDQDKLTKLIDYKPSTINKTLSNLVKKKILLKGKLQKLYLIDMCYFVIGNAKKIKALHDLFSKNENPSDLIEKYEKAERPTFQEDILKGSLEQKRANLKDSKLLKEAEKRFDV